MTELRETLASIAGWLRDSVEPVIALMKVAEIHVLAIAQDLARLTGLDAGSQAMGLLALICVVVASLGFWLFKKVGRRDPTSKNDLSHLTRAPKRIGLTAASVCLLAFIGWSAFAPLASAVLAPGVIGPEGNRKTVQHLEGGIIRAIHVREGDVVAEGETLISLEDTAARSLDAQIRERLLHVMAAEARLKAEESDARDIEFPPLLAAVEASELPQVIDDQRRMLATRRATHQRRIQILEARVLQLEEQNAGLQAVIAAEEEQLALVDEEITSSEALLDLGLERRPRILALRRTRASIVASSAANRASIAENAQAIGETRLQLLAVEEERQEEVATELAEVRRVLAELRGQLPSREDILQRTAIRSPSTGTVMNLRATTVGGVVRPGEPLLDIVPKDARLIINVQVRPTDVERVAIGMSARVVLSAYKQRVMPLVHGRVLSISADAFFDDRNAQTYFLTKVEVLPEDLASLPEVTLVPGMPAEVILLDGEQTLFEYLLAPIIQSQRRSFREN